MKKILMTTTLLLIILLTGCIQEGTSTDTIYGYDKGPIWNHVYLKNDHTTTYCFEDNLQDDIEQAYKNNTVVTIHYNKYWFRGALCNPQPNTEPVVVESIT